MSQDQRQAWFARMMESGLEHSIFQASDEMFEGIARGDYEWIRV